MTRSSDDDRTASPERLREQVEEIRHELGETVGALAARSDVKARAQRKAADVRQHASATAGQLRTRAAGLAHQVQDKVPEPAKDTAARGTRAARDHRALLVAAGAGAALVWAAYRSRRK
ncbi:DUF3618 domain-containing protein [Streptomyces sp. NPDC093094]|uniref:DUF3618 domain-containing protein n=1 Tax=Streptomyces sp. NPDC093094 TaxID=3366026 RepID=UPI0037F74C3A